MSEFPTATNLFIMVLTFFILVKTIINFMKTKCCSSCKLTKEITEFNSNKTKLDGIQTRCKECNKQYLRQHYLNNKDYYRAKAKKSEEFISHVISSIKANTPCEDCKSYYDPICMDFDHLEQNEKLYNVSKGICFGYSLFRILKEIDKCEIVCANCHRLRTKNRRVNM